MRSMRSLLAVLLVAGGLPAAVQAAVLSGNLVTNGDFESVANLKNTTAPDGVLPHRFSQTYDLGQWVGHWGPASVPGGLGGFSTFDDPRDVGEVGGNSQTNSDLGNVNRSVDPTDAGNHLMETVMFRPKYAQWIEAPADHVAGPFEFAFDFYHLDGHPGDTRFDVRLYGMNVLPAHDVSFFDGTAAGAPSAVDPSDPAKASAAWGSEQFAPIDADGELLVRLRFGEGIEGKKDNTRFPDSDPLEYLGLWHHMDTGEYTTIPDPINPGQTYPGDPETGEPLYIWSAARNKVLTELTQTYPYYAVVVVPFIYDELDPYFFIFGSQVTDSFVMGMDNFSLELSVGGLPGDFDGSGMVDTQDINPFILALTQAGTYESTYGVAPAYYDPNGDGVVNTEDINPFIAILTDPGVAQIIPEPASVSLLVLGGLALGRRRR